MGFIKDTLLGKEKKLKADPLAGDFNAAAKTGIGYLNTGASKLNELYNQDPTQLVNTQIGMENKAIRNASDDAIRRTRSLIAQRGMGSSSIGLGQEVNQRKQLNDQLSMNNAGGIARLRNMQLENAQGIANTGNMLMAPKMAQGPIQMQDQKYRSDGLGQLIVAGAQAYASGGKG